MKEIDWEKVKITDEVMEYVIPKYGKTNWLLNDLYSHIILEDIYNTFYKDEAELAKVDDKRKGKIDDKGKGKIDDLVDAFEKGKSKLMVSKKGAHKTKEAKEAKVVEVSSDEEDFKRPTTSRAPIASTSTTSRSIVPIASTSNAQAAFTAPRGYRKIAMTGCVFGLKAPNDPNAPPPSTIRKRKP
ncbi:hypothetical protein Tco_0032105 [Tanacetum coccineum]